jgi:AcrR family transcriptional regulator
VDGNELISLTVSQSLRRGMVRTVKAPEVRRKDILAVAADLFMRQGYEATSVDQIVRVAAIAKGTFYYHFSSKKLSKNYVNRLRSVCVKLIQVMDSAEVGQSS